MGTLVPLGVRYPQRGSPEEITEATLKKLIVLGVVGLWLGVEIIAPQVAAGRIEQRVSERTEGITGVSASVRSFPLVTRLAITGDVRRVTITLEEVLRQRLTFTHIRFDFEGAELDRSALLRRQVDIREIDRGTITGEIDLGAFGDAVGAVVDLIPAEVELVVEDHNLVMRRGRLPSLNIPIPEDLFPCDPGAQVSDGVIVVSCTIHEIPTKIADAARGQA